MRSSAGHREQSVRGRESRGSKCGGRACAAGPVKAGPQRKARRQADGWAGAAPMGAGASKPTVERGARGALARVESIAGGKRGGVAAEKVRKTCCWSEEKRAGGGGLCRDVSASERGVAMQRRALKNGPRVQSTREPVQPLPHRSHASVLSVNVCCGRPAARCATSCQVAGPWFQAVDTQGEVARRQRSSPACSSSASAAAAWAARAVTASSRNSRATQTVG